MQTRIAPHPLLTLTVTVTLRLLTSVSVHATVNYISTNVCYFFPLPLITAQQRLNTLDSDCRIFRISVYPLLGFPLVRMHQKSHSAVYSFVLPTSFKYSVCSCCRLLHKLISVTSFRSTKKFTQPSSIIFWLILLTADHCSKQRNKRTCKESEQHDLVGGNDDSLGVMRCVCSEGFLHALDDCRACCEEPSYPGGSSLPAVFCCVTSGLAELTAWQWHGLAL